MTSISRTNAIAIVALKDRLANIEDNLYRYRHFGKSTDLTGNGETYASVIESLSAARDELRSAIDDLPRNDGKGEK